MKKVVLDTSLFVNPASAHRYGNSPTSAVAAFLAFAGGHAVELLMPPSVYQELMHFAVEKEIPAELRALIQQIPPKKHELKIPGIFIYELVETMRDRIDRGLRAAERHVREALAKPQPTPTDSPSKGPRPDAESIGRLRETYRRIMREGMLDSRMDVDLLLLAYEREAYLASADLGVLSWAENLGVAIVPHDQLREFIVGMGVRARV